MNTPNEPNTQTDLTRVLEKIAEIEKKSADSDYIYRGEPECFEKVSSNLYRKLEELGFPNARIEYIQKAELMKAKRYIKRTDDFEVLTEIQHFAGKTNLIDFTSDHRVALFFACDRSPFEDGRVILQNKNGTMSEWIKAPRNPEPGSRSDVQKSIFVSPPAGFFQPTDDDIVIIPKDLKQSILKYLESEFCISAEIIYPDLHGFVTSQDLRWDASIEFSKGCTCDEKTRETKDSKEKDEIYQKAVVHFTKAIELMPEFAGAYDTRGLAYVGKGEFEKAFQDFNKAIDLDPEDGQAYKNRGFAYSEKGEFDIALQDFNKAIDLDPQLAEAYLYRGTVYSETGKFEKAIQDLNKAINLNPEDAEAYNRRGIAYSKTGNLTPLSKTSALL